MQKLADQGYTVLICAITNSKDEISFRLQNEVDPHSEFLKKNPVCLAQYRSKYTNHKTVDQRKSKFTKKNTRCCKCYQSHVDNFSLPVSLAASMAAPIHFPRALTRYADLALWPVEMFTISCSSRLNGWIIWLLMTPVIFFSHSFRLVCWCHHGDCCHLDPSVPLPSSALTLLSKLAELASISSWLLTNVSEEFGLGITVVCLL